MEQSIYERNSMTSMISVMPNQVQEAIGSSGTKHHLPFFFWGEV